jgi:hypothetical protein
LPRSFPQDVFDGIHEWYGRRPNIQPPHIRDLLSHEDGNFRGLSNSATQDARDEVESEPETEDPLDFTETDVVEVSEEHTPGPPQRSTADIAARASPAASRGAAATASTCSTTPRPSNGLPPGIISYYISTSDASKFNLRHRPGNTAVRRKSLSSQNIIAEATKASSDIMAGQMREMAEASRELERSKIEVQLKLFTEQMLYQREKDRRLYENSIIVNENAHLAIQKQGEVVNCLAQLSAVISRGMTMPYSSSSEGQAAGVLPNNNTEAEATPGGPPSSPTATTSTKDTSPMQQ